MRPVQFDSFGEPVALLVHDEHSPVSRIALRSGVGLFWAMVLAIVAARVVYFDSDFTERFGSVVSLIGQFRTVVGV